ncbi:hypothetical protein ACF0H5_008496 [Mactra antiquata]
MADYESNIDGGRKMKIKKTSSNTTEFEDLILRWIRDANTRSISLTGALIQERARLFASDLGLEDFKASNGWLHKFLKRHNLSCKMMSGERGDVNSNTVEEWKSRLPKICEGYELRDIFNMDESGIFFKSGGRTTYCDKNVQCAGGKRAKDRVTVALCASATGEKLKPLVIGKSRRPRCFGKVKVESLPVCYKNNKKAWMNSRIYEEWLTGLDKKMRRQNRNILLFIDNASSHVDMELRNVKVVKLPANCTSVLQPMDQGIIQSLKLKFYKHQSTYILGKMEKSSMSGSELLKTVTLLDTVYWIDRSWRNVEPTTITKCFNKCGFGNVNMPVSDSDSDCDDDDDIPLTELARVESIYGEKFIDMVNLHIETNDNETVDWSQPTIDLIKASSSCETDSESETEEESKKPIISLGQAQEYIELIKEMARERGMVTLLKEVSDAATTLSEERVRSQSVQRKISDYFC